MRLPLGLIEGRFRVFVYKNDGVIGGALKGVGGLLELIPRGSKYRIFKVSGSKNHTLNGVFGTRDLKYWVLGPSG